MRNRLPDPTTIHWHGIALRNDMDGVPDLTQSAIAPGADFTYEFAVPDAGTYFFHPHVGTQLDRGLYAPLIVEDPAEPGAYDREFVVALDDWLGASRTPDEVLEGLREGMSAWVTVSLCPPRTTRNGVSDPALMIRKRSRSPGFASNVAGACATSGNAPALATVTTTSYRSPIPRSTASTSTGRTGKPMAGMSGGSGGMGGMDMGGGDQPDQDDVPLGVDTGDVQYLLYLINGRPPQV